MAMTYLLDDPSPRVRLSLAEAVARAPNAPRGIILSLAEDQPEIAGQVILLSPVFTDADLVDLALRGSDVTRVLIASRGQVSRPVSAALAEIGGETEILCLLENDAASLSRASLKRIAERLGDHAEIRGQLLARDALPSDVRHLLIRHVCAALSGSNLIQATIGAGRSATWNLRISRTETFSSMPPPDVCDASRQIRVASTKTTLISRGRPADS